MCTALLCNLFIYLFTYLITLNGTALSLAHLRSVTYLKLSSKVTQMVAENVFSHISHCEIDNDPYTFSVHVPGLYVHNSLVNVMLPIKI